MRLILCVFTLFTLSCKNEDSGPPPFDSHKIEGRWIITDAMRKNRTTQTVNGAIFDISDSTLTHNMFGQDSTFQITWGTSSMNAVMDTFYIESSMDSLLVLKCILQKLPFRISLKKLNGDQGELLE